MLPDFNRISAELPAFGMEVVTVLVAEAVAFPRSGKRHMLSKIAVVVAAVVVAFQAVFSRLPMDGLAYVITPSGDVRSSIDTDQVDEVACQSQGGLVSRRPPSAQFDGARGDLAIVNPAGEFSWEFGDISSRGDDTTLDCGQNHHILGRTILQTSDGTPIRTASFDNLTGNNCCASCYAPLRQLAPRRLGSSARRPLLVFAVRRQDSNGGSITDTECSLLLTT
ncbi:hypothetical protein ACORG1_04565 [Mycobacterium sp. TJFP1]